MSIFKDVKNTMKSIFNADEEGYFEDEAEFQDTSSNKSILPKIPFVNKKKNIGEEAELPSFDISKHDFMKAKTQGAVGTNKSNGRIQVYVPKSYEESFNIIKDVKNGFTAMVNVEVATPQISQRIIDTISGAIYAMDGECKKMGEKQYIFSLSTETVGAYDYLPVSGQQQSNNMGYFNFNMQNNEYPMQQQNQPMFPQFTQMPMQPPTFGMQNNSFANIQQPQPNLQQQQQPSHTSNFFTPPQSQF